jgi:hypothetical protein
MHNFYDNIQDEIANDLQQVSKLHYELRENLNNLLKRYGVSDTAALLAGIQSGEIAEHPAYEDYLSARILDDTRNTARELMKQLAEQANRT